MQWIQRLVEGHSAGLGTATPVIDVEVGAGMPANSCPNLADKESWTSSTNTPNPTESGQTPEHENARISDNPGPWRLN